MHTGKVEEVVIDEREHVLE